MTQHCPLEATSDLFFCIKRCISNGMKTVQLYDNSKYGINEMFNIYQTLLYKVFKY